VQEKSPLLSAAQTFLMMPDLFNFWFTGRKVDEFTIATTSQCYNPRTGDWAWDLLERLGIPTRMFKEIVQPGTVLDTLLASVAEETGAGRIPVVTPACHDTGDAVAAVPVSDPDYIYLSSGTWSLMGVEIDEPIITPESLACDITNEGGVEGKFRFLKNIMGMWLLQECRREWSLQGKSYSYDDLTRLAQAAPGFGPLIVTGDPAFLAPGGMPARIQSYCQKTGQEPPQTEGEITRCILESLAMEYRWVAERLDNLRGRRMTTIHIIGGGSRNKALNQFTADATNRTVVAGPVEATAIGNVLVQALALGQIGSLQEARSIVGRSFEVTTFSPKGTAAWDAAYQRYLRLKSAGDCGG
jgi:rhamnulokinase